MAERSNIIILQLADFAPAGLVELLHREEFNTRMVQDVADTPEVAKEMIDPVLLALCGATEEKAINNTRALLQSAKLYSYPLVAIGKDIDALEGPLEQRFGFVVALSTPCENREIFDAIVFAARSATSDLVEEEEAHTPIPAPGARDDYLHEVSVRPDIHPKYRQYSSYPKLMFSELEKQGLQDKTLGGRAYANYSSHERLRADGYLPPNPEIRQVISQMEKELGNRGTAQLCRTNFISSQIGDALDFSSTTLNESKAASFLFALAFAGTGSDLLEKNYLASQEEDRLEVVLKMKMSADLVRTRLNEPIIADLILAMSHLVNKESAEMDEETFMTASLLVAADLVDRVCFDRGKWNPRGVHYLMNKIKGGKLLELHPVIISCVVKFITEAVSNLPKIFIVPGDDWSDREFQKAARETRDYMPCSDEIQVPVTALEPGMRLARPLVSFDGRTILEEGLLLDEDLIWRIWQLSAIRLLNTPVTISSEEAALA